MKVEVVVRFVERGVVVRHPGEIIEVSPETAERFIQEGLAKAISQGDPVPRDPAGKGKPRKRKEAEDEGESA